MVSLRSAESADLSSIGKCFWDDLLGQWVAVDTNKEVQQTFEAN